MVYLISLILIIILISISDANKLDPNFIFKSSVILEENINYKTFYSDLEINYDVSNLNVDFINYEHSMISQSNDDNTTNCTLTFKTTDSLTCNIVLNPDLSFDKNTIKAEDLTSDIVIINQTFSKNLNLIDDIASNYNFTYNYSNVILLPEDLTCNITHSYEFNSNIINVSSVSSNMMYINYEIIIDIVPFDIKDFYYQHKNIEIDTHQLDNNGIYNNIFLTTTTSNIVRINSNINDISGTFSVERDNTIIYKTSNILPISFANLSILDNKLEYSSNINIEDGNFNMHISSSNFVVNNNINDISRDLELTLLNSNYLIEDNFEIYGYNFTNNIYFKEYFNKLSDSQTDDYIIKIKNYNYKKFQPHIKLLNEVDGLNKITGHEIYSYDGILEIKYSDNGTNNWVPLKIDANGNTFIKGGLEMEGDIRFDGKIYDANGNDLIEILNKDYYKEYQVNSSNIHFNSDGSNGVEIHAYSSSNYDDFKFFNVQDFLDGGIITDVMVLHKRLNEVPQYKIDLYGDIDTSNGILRVEGRDIIRDTCNYILDSSNVLSNKISNLETDSISEEAHSKNRFIVNHEYNNDLLINGELRINSNLIVLGEQTRLDTQVYSSEQIEIVNNNTDVALKITQTGTSDIVNIFNNTSKIFTILQSGNVGINTNNPNVSLEINRTDSIKIPVGTNVQRPTYGAKGYIRYNTDLDRFEGFGGTGNTWGALGGIKDLDGDTYISSENASGEDNDELKFITSNFERMIITSNGLVGIGNTEPEYKLDLFGDFRSDGNIFVNRKIGINTYSPDFTIHMDTNDGILIPSGNTINRPNDEILKKGVIRYNTDNDEFEGYGPGGSWGSLGGVKDVNGDTYISAENNPGDNNDELKFFTSNFERMVLTSNGNLGIGNTKPEYKLDLFGDFRSDGNIFVNRKIGINTYSPDFTIHMDTNDGILIPAGETSNRPDAGILKKGVIRYNTDYRPSLKVLVPGGSWGALGGVKDVNGDTYISAENNPGDNNDELKFFTSNLERMVITSNGNLGIGNTKPNYKLDLFGDFRSDGNIFVNRKIGINTYSPDFTIHMDTNDGILIPAGETSNRPDAGILKKGVIRYNTDYRPSLKVLVPGGSWGALGGVKDVNGDTYISAENNPGDNNDELKFFTSNLERMVITSNGNLGIGNTKPNYKIDVNGEVNASAFNINGVPFRLEFPKGMMLQTKHITYTGTRTKSDIQTDWVPIDDNITTGFVINVKPSHVTSKILLNLICHIGMDYLQTSKWWGLKLYRKIGTGNWTEVLGANGTGDNNGSACWISHNLGAESSIYSHSITNVTGSYEDEPSTTDDVYYTIYWKSRLDGTGARLYLNKSAESHSDNYPKPSSSLSASEIWNNGVPYIPPISSSVISLSGEKVGIGCVPTHDSPYKLNVYGDIKCHNLFQTSDKRYKNNIEQLDSILHLINDIVPVSYNTENDSKTKYGFIAQDLEDIIPDIVNIPRDRKDLYSIDYISMIPLLTKSIQELSNIINNQQKEINKLKSKL